MRMLVRQNKYYNNLTNINNIGDEENNENEDNDYGHFYELDIEEPIQKNITNYNKYYVYNYIFMFPFNFFIHLFSFQPPIFLCFFYFSFHSSNSISCIKFVSYTSVRFPFYCFVSVVRNIIYI